MPRALSQLTARPCRVRPEVKRAETLPANCAIHSCEALYAKAKTLLRSQSSDQARGKLEKGSVVL